LGKRLLRAVFENYRSGPIFGLVLFHGLRYVLILTKNGLGYMLGDFFSQTHLFAQVTVKNKMSIFTLKEPKTGKEADTRT
jgi:hypothetical protein